MTESKITHNYIKTRFYLFTKSQVDEMIEVDGLGLAGDIPTDKVLFKKMAETVLVKLGGKISKGSNADIVKAIISWPKSGSIGGVVLEVEEHWKDKLPKYIDLLKS